MSTAFSSATVTTSDFAALSIEITSPPVVAMRALSVAASAEASAAAAGATTNRTARHAPMIFIINPPLSVRVAARNARPACLARRCGEEQQPACRAITG